MFSRNSNVYGSTIWWTSEPNCVPMFNLVVFENLFVIEEGISYTNRLGRSALSKSSADGCRKGRRAGSLELEFKPSLVQQVTSTHCICYKTNKSAPAARQVGAKSEGQARLPLL